MNKTELIAAVAEKAELSKKDAEAAITAMVDAITEALSQEEKVQLVGFGSFEVKVRAERLGRNPKTKEEIHIAHLHVIAGLHRPAIGRHPGVVTGLVGHRAPLDQPGDLQQFVQSHVACSFLLCISKPSPHRGEGGMA